MYIYICLLVLVLFLLINRNNKVYIYCNNTVILFVSVLLFLLCIFRSVSVGTDYHMYYHVFLFYTYPQMILDYMEPGFSHIIALAQLHNNFLIISSIVIIVDLIAIYVINKKFRVNKFTLMSFYILTGLYFQSFSALRQLLAIGIVYIGACFLFKHNRFYIIGAIIFIICIFLAKDFHKSAIFSLIFLILPFIKYNKLTVLISGILTTVFFFVGNISNLLQVILSKIPFYGVKYQSGQFGNHSSLLGMCIQVIPIILQFLFLYLFVSNYKIKSSKERFILSGYLLYLILFIGFNNTVMRRFQIYTFIFPILYSCLFIDSVNFDNIKRYTKNNINSNSNILIKSIYIAFWIFLYIGKLISNKINIVPYIFR